MMEVKQEEKPVKLMDKVKVAIKWFEWQSFTVEELFIALDAHGHEGRYNRGGIKGAILPALRRQQFIEVVGGTDAAPVFAQAAAPRKGARPQETKKPAGSPSVRQLTPTTSRRESWRQTGPNPNKKREAVLPLFAVMVAASRPLFCSEIAKRVEKFTGEAWAMGRIHAAMSRYHIKGWITRQRSTLIKANGKQYQLTVEFYLDHQDKADKIAAAIPELSDDVQAKFARIFKGCFPTDAPEETAPETDAAAALDDAAPVDWDTPEHRIGAAELGAAIVEFIRRLQANQNSEKNNAKARLKTDELQYKLDDLAATIITKDAAISTLKRDIKGLKIKLEAAEKAAENLREENQQLTIKANLLDPKRPKTSFKMSEMLHVKKLLDGDDSGGLTITESV